MSNWKDLIRKEDDPENRAKMMDIYRNLNLELKKAANELEKYGHKLRQNDAYVRLMVSIKEEWENLRDGGEIFGFGKKKEPRWANNPVCQTYEENLAALEAVYKAAQGKAAKKVALAAYRTLKHEFERECLKIR